MVPITSPITQQSRRYQRIAEAAAYLNVSVALLRKLKGTGARAEGVSPKKTRSQHGPN